RDLHQRRRTKRTARADERRGQVPLFGSVHKTRHETAGPQDSLKCTGAEEMRGHVRYRLVRGPLRPAIWRRIQTARHLCEGIHLSRASPFSIAIRITSTLSTFSTSSTSTFSTSVVFS